MRLLWMMIWWRKGSTKRYGEQMEQMMKCVKEGREREAEKGENREVWEMKERSWWRWGRVVNWKEMNELEGLGDEDVAVRKWEQRE